MLERISLVIENHVRHYWWWGQPRQRSLVLFLHGTGAAVPWADTETGWSSAAQRHGFAIALPEALPLNPRLPANFRDNPTRWRAEDDPTTPALISTPPGATAKPAATPSVDDPDPKVSSLYPNVDDVAFLDAVIKDIQQRLNQQVTHVFLTGFSNGAAMVFRYAAARSERLTAVAPVAGYCRCSRQQQLNRPVTTLYMIGDADPLVPLRGGWVTSPWGNRLVQRPPVVDSLERWAALLGCSVISKVVEDNPEFRREVYPGPVPFHVVIVKGLGHHWPGGQGGWNSPLAGPHHARLQATEFIWRFFEDQLIRKVNE